MTRDWIEFPRIEGKTSHQAHADLPEGTFEREIGRDGFYRPGGASLSPPSAHRLDLV